MKNTAYWEEIFQEPTNTAKERKELIDEAFECSGDFATQEAFCEVANRYGYFNNVDFVLDMMNDDIGGGFLADCGAGDFLCNYGLLGDIDFVFNHIFDFINSSKFHGYNLALYMIQAFGLKKCIEKEPEKFLKVLENDWNHHGSLYMCFLDEPEAFFADIPENLKVTYAWLFEKFRIECNASLDYDATRAEDWNKFWTATVS